IGLDATNAVYSSAGGVTLQVTNSVTLGNGTNRLMLVGISAIKGVFATNVTAYGSSTTPLTFYGAVTNSSGFLPYVSIWYTINPSVGTNNVVALFNDNIDQGVVVGVATFTNV